MAFVLALLCGHALALESPKRGGIAFPGFQPVTLSLGGVRSLGFGDPVSLATNPSAISPELGANQYSVCYGPVVTHLSFSDGSGSHEDSWTEPLGSSSLGIDLDVMESLTLGLAVVSTSQLPFTKVYYVPGYDKAGQDIMVIEGSAGELDLGCAWAATDWLVVGGAVGFRFFRQTFDINYADSMGTITGLEYEWSETCFNTGISIPLEGVTIGLCWSSPGDFNEAVLAGGGMVDIVEGFSAGGELELADVEGGSILTGRIFCVARPFAPLTFRAGAFLAGHSEEIRREGLGLSGGAGYSFGNIIVNSGISWSTIKGDRDIYGYESLESYEGDTYIVSLGALFTGPTE